MYFEIKKWQIIRPLVAKIQLWALGLFFWVDFNHNK